MKALALENFFPQGAARPAHGKVTRPRSVARLPRRAASRSRLPDLAISKNLTVAVAAAIVVLFGFYLYQANHDAALGYQLSSLHKQISQLTSENQQLMVQSAAVGSVTLDDQSFQASWVAVKTPEFWQAPRQLSQR